MLGGTDRPAEGAAADAAGNAAEIAGSAGCGGGGEGSDAGGGGGCVKPVHAACIIPMLRLICAMFWDISATTAARDSSVRGWPPDAAEGAAAEDIAAESGAVEEGGGSKAVEGELVVGSGGIGGEPDIPDTRLIGFLVLPGTSRREYG